MELKKEKKQRRTDDYISFYKGDAIFHVASFCTLYTTSDCVILQQMRTRAIN